jgi:adenylate cyclase
MTTTAQAPGAARPPGGSARDVRTLEREVRLWAGLILMVFAASHFLNHALGIFGVSVMSEAQTLRTAVWRSWPGTILLYGALAVHVALSLRRLIGRRTWRMPPLEAFQIALGILIPVLLFGHVVGTRTLSSFAGTDDSYVNVLRYLWPASAWTQSLALLVVWTHGVIGLYYAFHVRRWFKPLKMPLAVLAGLVPALALAGFAAAGREAALSNLPPETFTAQQLSLQATLLSNVRWAVLGVLGVAAAAIAFRLIRARLGEKVTIRYVGQGEVRAASGATLLEISRSGGVPHPSTCGGKGRCSTCRVLVIEGEQSLAPPAGIEKDMLERIRAPRQVRLACQVRPTADMNIRVLMSGRAVISIPEAANESLDWGVTEDLTILFADVRGFASLAENQLPSDTVALVNRLISEMGQAVEGRGGRVSMVQTDGIAAVFGMGGKARAGARAALDAAADMLKAIHLVNKDIRNSLPLPVRVGIGVHSGPVLVSRADDSFGGQRLLVIGEAVVVASRLEDATKEFAADCVVSSRAIGLAGLKEPAAGERQVHYKNGKTPVLAHAFGDRQELRTLLGRRTDAGGFPEAAPAPASTTA